MNVTDIITYPQRIGTTDYLPADKIDVQNMLGIGLLNERLLGQMREQDKIKAATPETFRIAAARRPAGAPWPPRGFTEAYLVEAGLIDPPSTAEEPAAAEEKPKKAGKPKADRVTYISLTPEAIHIGAYRLQPTKRGNFVFWCAADAEGKILRDALFKNSPAGVAYLEDLLLKGPGAGTPEVEKQAEPSDGGDIRPGAVDAKGQDQAADRAD